MPKRRAKRTAKQPVPSPGPAFDGRDPNSAPEELSTIDLEVEPQCAAIGAMRDMEIERLLTRLRLLRSYFDDKQIQTPALQFFKENLPNLSIVRNEGNEEFEVRWNDKGKDLCVNRATGKRDVHSSLLHSLSAAYPECSAMPSFAGFELSTDAARTNFFGADNLQIRDFVLDGPSDSQMQGMLDSLQTPGVSTQRLSMGMTPKTLRVPKPGEMLLSVRGSPLGVYNCKEDNMECIHESEEG